jgi:hypothetical protein
MKGLTSNRQRISLYHPTETLYEQMFLHSDPVHGDSTSEHSVELRPHPPCDNRSSENGLVLPSVSGLCEARAS